MLRFPTLIMMRFSTLVFLTGALALLVPACASNPDNPGDTVLDAEDYDQTCQTADDCEVVLVGNICGCGCDYGVISSSELEKFQADDTAAREACDSALECTPCPDSPAPECSAGKCTVPQP